jgi:hypothetical protein
VESEIWKIQEDPMTTIALFFRKTLLALLVTAIGLGVLPLTAVYAAGPSDNLGLGRWALNRARLERIFDMQQERYAHQTQLLARIPTLSERIQGLIDRASAKGLDAAAVQTALDNFATAVPAAQSAHDQAGALLSTHTGFDDKGKVTDLSVALQTVKSIHQANLTFREALLPPFRALRQAIRTFAQLNDIRQFRNPMSTP